MKIFNCLAFPVFFLSTFPVIGDESKTTVIFEDNFDRNESQEVTNEVGDGWFSNSTKETKGKSRQFDLKNGALQITQILYEN